MRFQFSNDWLEHQSVDCTLKTIYWNIYKLNSILRMNLTQDIRGDYPKKVIIPRGRKPLKKTNLWPSYNAMYELIAHRQSEWSSVKERRVDALALRADERRDKLRKASGRSKYPLIRRYLNGETRLRRPQSSIRQSITYGGEPPELKHLSRARKRKKNRFPK